MKRVLFVDDEERVLDGIRRMMRSMREEWAMEFAASGAAALEVMEKHPFDIVVADMKMPGMDGATLLQEVKRRQPGTIRIILSGHSEKELVMKAVGPTHQYLNKPCDPDVLKTTIDRAYGLRALLESPALKKITSGLDSVPSLPALYQQVVAELQKPGASLPTIGRVIQSDMGMSAKILKLVNSAYFGLAQRISSVERAVTYLGLETISALVLGTSIFLESDEPRPGGLDLEALWHRSMKTAAFARAICGSEDLDKQTADDAFLAALLHDIGKIILAVNMPGPYADVMEAVSSRTNAVWKIEEQRLGTHHAAIGAYLIGLWGLPDSVVEAIAYHHAPSSCPTSEFGSLTIVHAACALAAHPEAVMPAAAPTADCAYLEALGLDARWGAWQAACAAVDTEREPT
ncbi:MAG: HDOD domain-containing protein [Acidobacteriota bacterium]